MTGLTTRCKLLRESAADLRLRRNFRAKLIGSPSDHHLSRTTSAMLLSPRLKTVVLGFATLSDVHWSLSGEVVLMTLLGGMGTFTGPVPGALAVLRLQNFLADRVGSQVQVIIRAIFVVCVSAFRHGLIGEPLAWTASALRRHGRRDGGAPDSKSEKILRNSEIQWRRESVADSPPSY